MANLTEAFPPPSYNVASLWSSLWGEVDRTQWQWQAPRNQNSASRETTIGWLAELKKRQEDSSEENSALRIAQGKRVARGPSIHKDIASHRQRIKACHPDDLAAICNNLNRTIKHCLTIGQMSERAIVDALRGIPNDLHHTFPNVAADLCLSFYAATWEGLVTCRVLRPDQLGDGSIKILLHLITKLPFTSEVQLLALDIMSRMSEAQQEDAAISIQILLDRALDFWLQKCSSRQHSVRGTRVTWKPLNFGDAKLDIARQNIAALETIEHHVPKALIRALQCLPHDMRLSFLRRGSKSVSQFYDCAEYLCSDIRYSWLSLVSQMQGVKNTIFVQTWKIMETATAPLYHDIKTPLHQNIMSSIVLRHWINVGWVRKAALVQQTFDSICSNEANPGFGWLVHVLQKHQEDVWRADGQLLKMLSDLGQFDTIYDTICHMKSTGVEIPVRTCAVVLQAMATHDPVMALNTYEICLSMRARENVGFHQYFPHEYYPEFILSMIKDSRVSLNRIWKSLELPAPKRNNTNTEILPPALADLITGMAVTFARCETRSPRVILRNVERCVQLLRRDRTTPCPSLSRAVTRASINLKIEFDKLVPTERAAWAVRIIQAAEGPEVAATVGMIVDVWNRRKLEEAKEVWRKENVLRVGPID